MFLDHISTFFETLKPNSQETAQIMKNAFYKSFLELLFTPIFQWTNPYHFQKTS